jgi:hypothetical protein
VLLRKNHEEYGKLCDRRQHGQGHGVNNEVGKKKKNMTKEKMSEISSIVPLNPMADIFCSFIQLQSMLITATPSYSSSSSSFSSSSSSSSSLKITPTLAHIYLEEYQLFEKMFSDQLVSNSCSDMLLLQMLVIAIYPIYLITSSIHYINDIEAIRNGNNENIEVEIFMSLAVGFILNFSSLLADHIKISKPLLNNILFKSMNHNGGGGDSGSKQASNVSRSSTDPSSNKKTYHQQQQHQQQHQQQQQQPLHRAASTPLSPSSPTPQKGGDNGSGKRVKFLMPFSSVSEWLIHNKLDCLPNTFPQNKPSSFSNHSSPRHQHQPMRSHHGMGRQNSAKLGLIPAAVKSFQDVGEKKWRNGLQQVAGKLQVLLKGGVEKKEKGGGDVLHNKKDMNQNEQRSQSNPKRNNNNNNNRNSSKGGPKEHGEGNPNTKRRKGQPEEKLNPLLSENEREGDQEVVVEEEDDISTMKTQEEEDDDEDLFTTTTTTTTAPSPTAGGGSGESSSSTTTTPHLIEHDELRGCLPFEGLFNNSDGSDGLHLKGHGTKRGSLDKESNEIAATLYRAKIVSRYAVHFIC